MLRGLKSLTYTKCENLVRDLTADSDTPPDQTQLAQLATYTLTGTKEQYTKVMAMISKRMTDYPKIKHVKKALLVIDFGLTNFSDKFVSDIAQQQSVIQRITKYRYYKNGETDIAGPVRELAASILLKLSDDIDETRAGSKANRAASPAAPAPSPAAPAPAVDHFEPSKQQEEEVAPAPDVDEDKATDAEANAVKFDTWAEGSVEVKGRVGVNEGRVNGVYAPRPAEFNVGGRTSYIKEAQMEDPIVLWFWEANQGVWMISRESGIGSDQAYACVRTGTEVESPQDIEEGKTWMVFDRSINGGKGGYGKDNGISVTLC